MLIYFVGRGQRLAVSAMQGEQALQLMLPDES